MSQLHENEITARIALRDLKEKTKLIKIVTSKGNILIGLLLALVCISWTIAEYMDSNSTDNSSLSSFITIIPLLFLPVILGSVNHKFNSLVKLLEIDKQPLKKEESSK
jgi:hypothetical protein